jgi:alkanesulfonate monooxygenase SsuD/methylene tetrahydromethanopterin reductase-like flavin-dependent oxidoreductase (luciferase family)
VLPAFNNPLKLAGELAMLDALCSGRLDIGFARAFLPLEFSHFGVKLDESRARFEEGMEQVRLLLEQENVSSVGRFPVFTMSPRCRAQPSFRGRHSMSPPSQRKNRSSVRERPAMASWQFPWLAARWQS